MRTAVYYSNRDIRIQDTSRPKAGMGELLIRVEASGICGSDVMEWYRIGRVPLVLGHEIAGVVEEAGEGAEQYRPGTRVAVSHHVPCGSCAYCLNGHETVCDTLRTTNFDPGGFCEFLRLPAVNVQKGGVYPLPADVSFAAATFIEPLACVLRGQRLAGLMPGKAVLVIGSGIAGILHIHAARSLGAGFIAATDISQYRLAAAKKFGADAAFAAGEYNAEELRKLNNGRLADVVVLCAGAASAIQQAFDSVERDGTVLFFSAAEKDASVSLPVNKLFWRNERRLISSYAGTPADHREALELIRRKAVRVEEMITHRLGLSQIQEGFRLVAEARDSLKVVIEPQR